MKKFILEMLSSAEGEVSTKRVIGFLGFLFLSAMMIANVVSPKEISPSTDLIDAVKFIVATALFGNTIEKFASKSSSNDSSAE